MYNLRQPFINVVLEYLFNILENILSFQALWNCQVVSS